MASEQLSQVYIQLPSTLDVAGKWLFSALTGYVTMAFLLTALHTAPVGREFMGFTPERNNFMGIAPDRQWLGFTQYVTEKAFGHIKYQDPVTKQMITQAFDAPYLRVGEYPNTIWSSFPIRYATRRQKIGGSGTGAGAASPLAQPRISGGGVPATPSNPSTPSGAPPTPNRNGEAPAVGF
jgi:hypothetical protein